MLTKVNLKGALPPSIMRLSALRFRGGLMYSCALTRAYEVTGNEANILLKSYEKSKLSNRIITGFHEKFHAQEGIWKGLMRNIYLWLHDQCTLVWLLSPFIIVNAVLLLADSIRMWKLHIKNRMVKLSGHKLWTSPSCSTPWYSLLSKLLQVRIMEGTVEIQKYKIKKNNTCEYISAFVHEDMIQGTFHSDQIKPTAMESVTAFTVIAEKMQPVLDMLYINEPSALIAVRAMLKLAGVKVFFYPVPCAEEREFLTTIDERLLTNEDLKLI